MPLVDNANECPSLSRWASPVIVYYACLTLLLGIFEFCKKYNRYSMFVLIVLLDYFPNHK